MRINLNKLKTGDKVAFSGRVKKIVSHICRDNGETRSVSFTDGTILDWDNSLWELAELREAEVLWKGGPQSFGQRGYDSLADLDKGENRFYLQRSLEDGGFLLSEHTYFSDEQTAKEYAEKRVRQYQQWRFSNGN
jgi:hypothetical protein